MSHASDRAQESAKRRLTQTIFERKLAISKIPSEAHGPEILSLHHIWADKLHSALLEYTSAANMAIVSRIMQLLPRELRDKIYTHLWDMDTRHDARRTLLYWWDSFGEPWFEKDDDVRFSPWLAVPAMGLRPLHFVDQAFVGPVVAKEILECFKETAGRDVRPMGDEYPVAECGLLDASMGDFVRKDVFGVGVTVEELARNLDLRVNFQCDALVGFEDNGDSSVSDPDTKSLTQADYLSDLNDGATALLGIPATNRVIVYDEHGRCLKVRPRIVTLAIRQESHFLDRAFLDVLALISRVYNGLRRKGFTVKIQYYSEEIELKVLFDDEVWGWTDADWSRNLSLKNAFGQGVGDGRGSLSRAHVWAKLREYVFGDTSNFSFT